MQVLCHRSEAGTTRPRTWASSRGKRKHPHLRGVTTGSETHHSSYIIPDGTAPGVKADHSLPSSTQS